MTVMKPVRWIVVALLTLLCVLIGPIATGAQVATPAGMPVASPPTSMASPAASPVAAKPTDRDVTFKSGPDMLYGSLMTPASARGKVPAIVIISGSGPTDRNGNDPQFQHMNTNLNYARTLAGLGVASFRYDKVGSGKTGLTTHAGGKGVDFDLFANEARDAYRFLASQPGIDPHRILILGHSEGGLIALAAAANPAPSVEPAGLILAAPLSVRYLDLLQTQIDGQFDAVVKAGRLTSAQAQAYKDKLAAVINEIRTAGKVTTKVGIPSVDALFNPIGVAFLQQADKYDPPKLAASLPADLPVLVLRGEKDTQVSKGEVDGLVSALRARSSTNTEFIEIQNADHTFRIVPGTPNPAADYANPDLKFAPEVEVDLGSFLGKYGFLP